MKKYKLKEWVHMHMTTVFTLINLIILLIIAGVGIYIIILLIKALKTYINKNS